MTLFRKLRRDTVISVVGGRDLVGLYLADDPENLLLECSPKKADAIVKIWNNRHWREKDDYKYE
jgi:hypothetical protein